MALVPASVRVPALELVLAWELVPEQGLEPVLALALVRSQWQSNYQVIPPQQQKLEFFSFYPPKNFRTIPIKLFYC